MVMVMFSRVSPPSALVVFDPKLEVMSRRTTPLSIQHIWHIRTMDRKGPPGLLGKLTLAVPVVLLSGHHPRPPPGGPS